MRLPGRRWLSSAAVIGSLAALAACSSSGSSTASSPASSSSAGNTASAGLAKAQQMVTQLESTTAKYPLPTASVSGVSKLSGRTVYYVPLDAHIPGFFVTAQTMKVALAKAGLKFQECDGSGTPSTIASCVSQAAGAGAAGIILDAIPYGMAQNALDGAKGKGVPIIIAEETDSPSSVAYVQNSLPIYRQYCPGCTIAVKQITATQTNQQLQAAVSSNIQATPGVQYYYTEFEDSLQPTMSGIQQSGKSSSVGLAVAGGSVNGLGLLKGGQVVKAVVAVDQAYAGWALTDEILRMATKSGPATETFPSRLFNPQNTGSIQVPPAAQASGAWFGDDSYQSEFAQLWGVG